ncbi:DUF3558 domain-containing protein [Actinokineospora sp. G85]|uniref:DUF3558 domain-containing protein n=1 Tax=Actinokineospora sp. G85 TaxID=3406626 RepID=UPI003C76D371
MRKSQRLTLVLAAVACAGLAGCTESGSPVPISTPPGSNAAPTEQAGKHGAPAIANPLEPGRYFDDPCTLFSEDELKSFNLGRRLDAPVSTGPSCAWYDSAEHGLYAVVFNERNTDGLGTIYKANGEDKLGYFEPTTVNDYPAALADAGEDNRKSGDCNVFVGINSGMAFNVSVSLGDPATACTSVQEIASVVVDKLKEG